MCSSVFGPAIVPSLVMWPMRKTGTECFFATAMSMPAESRTCPTEPGIDELAAVCTVWIESMIAAAGRIFSISATMRSTDVSVKRRMPSFVCRGAVRAWRSAAATLRPRRRAPALRARAVPRPAAGESTCRCPARRRRASPRRTRDRRRARDRGWPCAWRRAARHRGRSHRSASARSPCSARTDARLPRARLPARTSSTRCSPGSVRATSTPARRTRCRRKRSLSLPTELDCSNGGRGLYGSWISAHERKAFHAETRRRGGEE
jgi:hypothetical protein